MKAIRNDILEIANQASLKILTENKTFEIRHIFNLKDKSVVGILLFLLGGIFLIVIPFIKTSDTISKILGVTIGLFVAVFSILLIIRQISDKLKVSKTLIEVQRNLKRKAIPINQNMEIKMKTEILKIRRSSSRSEFIIVSHYLKDYDKETHILQFQMDNRNSGEAIKLGNEITRMINEKFREIN